MNMQKSINTHVYAKKYHNTCVCKNIIAHVYALKVITVYAKKNYTCVFKKLLNTYAIKYDYTWVCNE